MAGEGYQVGLQLGNAVGNALYRGIADWREIQRDRQERKEFEGELAVDDQRRRRIAEETTPLTRAAYDQVKAMIRKYPTQARVITQPIPGSAREDGSPETEQVIRTPEGDIPFALLQQYDANEQDAFFRRQEAETDRIMQLQARYPQNRYIRQYTAGQFANLNRQQQALLTKLKAQQQEVELARARVDLERAQFERLRLAGADQRARDLETFKTDEQIRLEREKANLKGPEGPDVFQRQILVDTYKQGGKDIDAAQSGIDMLGQIDQTLERAEQVLVAGGARTGAIEGSAIGSGVQRLTNEENLNILEQAFGNQFLQAVQNMRGLGQLSDRDAQALQRTTGGLDKSEAFNLSDIRRRRAVLRGILARKAQERDLAVRNREAIIRESGFEGKIGTKGAPLPGAEAPAAGAPPAGPPAGATAAGSPVAPPVPPELFEDAAAVRRAYREGRIDRDEAVRRIAEME